MTNPFPLSILSHLTSISYNRILVVLFLDLVTNREHLKDLMIGAAGILCFNRCDNRFFQIVVVEITTIQQWR